MSDRSVSCFAGLEHPLRSLLPNELYAAMESDPASSTLMSAFEHLRSLRYILHNYVPRQVSAKPPIPGCSRYVWQEGSLLFTDLAGFTSLMEANAGQGQAGANALLNVLNTYLKVMLEIASKAGGDLLEFTGDSILVQFLSSTQHNNVVRAVRAGLRMQRAMTQFEQIETPRGIFSLKMRVGIHAGRFLAADVGTTSRMTRVLLGKAIQQAKQAEGASPIGRVCLTSIAANQLRHHFHFESLPLSEPSVPSSGYQLVVDDLTQSDLGDYDIVIDRHRSPHMPLFDCSQEALIGEIKALVHQVEPLAVYLPQPILKLVVNHAAQRQVPSGFPQATVLFVNLVGISDAIDDVQPDEVVSLIAHLNNIFSRIHIAVQALDGILKDITYHLDGSNVLIYFGVTRECNDDAFRAVRVADIIRNLTQSLPSPWVNGKPIAIAYRMGLARGIVFAAEFGESQGRREFNVLGDIVNTAARLKSYAGTNQILLTGNVYESIHAEPIGDTTFSQYPCKELGSVFLKGKLVSVPVFVLE